MQTGNAGGPNSQGDMADMTDQRNDWQQGGKLSLKFKNLQTSHTGPYFLSPGH